MIAKNNKILTSATESLYQLNADELIREQCQAREDFEKHERTQQKKLTEQEATIKEQANALAEKDSEIKKLADELALLRKEMEHLKQQL